MAVKIFVVEDSLAISFLVNDDVDGFKEYLESEEYLDFTEPETFNTEEQALAFCAGLGYGANENIAPERYPLRSFEEADRPFIDALESYT